FTQYERRDGGKLADLPQKNIDTGMGLERLAAVMQGKASVFETDLFAPIVRAVETLAGGGEAPAIRAIADHVRALTFLIRDGVMPGNEGRGYVLRMLLRRAARHGRRLGIAGPFLDRLVPAVVEAMGAGYPDLAGRAGRIAEVIRTEEERFDRTLEEKLPILRQTVERLGPGGVFPADAAARFYDTHGLSLEEIAESCRAAGVTPPPPADFEAALDQLQAASRAGSAFAGDVFAKDAARELVAGLKQTTRFIGYDRLSAAGRVVALLRGEKLEPSVKSAGPVGVILDATPFYGEAGGQVGDAGELTGPSGRLRVLDTQWIGATLLHRAELLEGKIAVGEQVTASVDPVRREQVARNHTATHLLHAALRKVLGEHVTQAGSLVAPDHLRFDFTHGRGLPAGERQSVEDLVNQWIAGHFPVRTDTMTMAQAREAGAMALFGEKYGDSVRVVSIGTVSKELCGGTHLHASDGVGLLTIVEEGSVAAGTRRVKALCAESALEGLEGQRLRQAEELERLIQATAELESCWKGLGGKVPAPLPKRGGAPAAGERSLAGYRAEFLRQAELLEQLKRRQKGAQRGIRERESAAARDKAGELTGETIGPWPVYLTQFSDPMDHAALRAFGDGVRKKEPSAVFFLADPRGFFVAGTGGRPEARALVRIATDLAGGSGGGRPELVQGKLADPGKFSEVKREQKRFIQEQAKAS
ncbi:MAG: alanine--tRNA ligase, partial [Candidatus Omnitrophica bacterium CG11_big_fil_rev_8_21_14_0_20_64_10]